MTAKTTMIDNMIVTNGVLDALAKNLYADPISAIAELVFNGFDSAHRAGRAPVVHIGFFESGEHPLSPDGVALSIIDLGEGFTPQVRTDYFKLGLSARVLNGRHGIGKMAARGLSTSHEFYITSRPSGEPQIRRTYIGQDILQQQVTWTHCRRSMAQGSDYLPKTGSFAEILITNFVGGVSPDQLREQLMLRLPISDWTVTVDDVTVQRRTFESSIRFETDPLPALGGAVTFELGLLTESACADDGVYLVDAELRRPVCRLGDVRRQLRIGGSIMDPRLVGSIFVPGLADESSANRDGLKSGFASTERGRALTEVINLWGNEQAAELLGEGHETEHSFTALLREQLCVFEQAFGKPEEIEDESLTREDPPSDPDDEDKPKDKKPPKGGTQRRRRRRGRRGGPSRGQTQQPTLCIEGETYSVFPIPLTPSPVPAKVSSGGVIAVYTENWRVADLLKRSRRAPRQFREELVMWLIEAHVHHSTSTTSAHERSYELLRRVISP